MKKQMNIGGLVVAAQILGTPDAFDAPVPSLTESESRRVCAVGLR
jgi:hypothetical protein